LWSWLGRRGCGGVWVGGLSFWVWVGLVPCQAFSRPGDAGATCLAENTKWSVRRRQLTSALDGIGGLCSPHEGGRLRNEAEGLW
jgi:hypothetical protein